jgi:hypothetical protein
MKPAEFWRLTPREFRRYMAGRVKAERRALAMTITGAWHVAAWSPGRTKKHKLPDLGRITRRILGEKRRVQTPAESLKIAERLNMLFGGKDLRKAK